MGRKAIQQIIRDRRQSSSLHAYIHAYVRGSTPKWSIVHNEYAVLFFLAFYFCLLFQVISTTTITSAILRPDSRRQPHTCQPSSLLTRPLWPPSMQPLRPKVAKRAAAGRMSVSGRPHTPLEDFLFPGLRLTWCIQRVFNSCTICLISQLPLPTVVTGVEAAVAGVEVLLRFNTPLSSSMPSLPLPPNIIPSWPRRTPTWALLPASWRLLRRPTGYVSSSSNDFPPLASARR